MVKLDKALPKDLRILQAAEKIFSLYGYEKATLDEIIALADVGKGTVYKYFGSNKKRSTKIVAIVKVLKFFLPTSKITVSYLLLSLFSLYTTQSVAAYKSHWYPQEQSYILFPVLRPLGIIKSFKIFSIFCSFKISRKYLSDLFSQISMKVWHVFMTYLGAGIS